MRFAFIHAEKAHHPVATMCRVLKVSTSGYYAYAQRKPSERQQSDNRLKPRIRAIHSRSRGTYGSPRVREQHHSDRGVQYSAHVYQNALSRNGIVCSMSRRGDCWDNAVTESFFARLKTELIQRQSWASQRAVKDAVADYIEGWYNPYRLHSSLGYVSPMQFESDYRLNGAQAA